MAKVQNSSAKFVVIITLVTIALISVLVVLSNMKSDENEDQTFEKQPSIEGQPTIGNVDAPVTIVEFGDFKCPSCKAWGETIFPQLEQDYVDTGKVKFSYINVLFHGKESQLGSLAAETVFKQNPDAYWEFHKGLFNAQPQDHDSEWLTPDKVYEIAGGISDFDVNKFQSELEQLTEIEEVNKDSALVEEYKVQFTPSIMVNGTMLEDPFDYDKIESLIEKELEGK
jgi:protein-disulfide isomerase